MSNVVREHSRGNRSSYQLDSTTQTSNSVKPKNPCCRRGTIFPRDTANKIRPKRNWNLNENNRKRNSNRKGNVKKIFSNEKKEKTTYRRLLSISSSGDIPR